MIGYGDARPIYPERYLAGTCPTPARTPRQIAVIRDEIDRRVRVLLAELVAAES